MARNADVTQVVGAVGLAAADVKPQQAAAATRTPSANT